MLQHVSAGAGLCGLRRFSGSAAARIVEVPTQGSKAVRDVGLELSSTQEELCPSTEQHNGEVSPSREQQGPKAMWDAVQTLSSGEAGCGSMWSRSFSLSPFAFSCTMFELIIFEILGALSSRYFHWKLNLYVILLVPIFVVPFYIGYFVVSNIRLCQCVDCKDRSLLFACVVWFTFMYFFWKLGDPFPILSPKHDYEVRQYVVQVVFSITFAFSCTMFELIIFEILGALSSRYFHWKLNLYVILLVPIFVVPFYIGYFVVSNILQRQKLLFACVVWFTFMYFFWKLGDPFPILSPKHAVSGSSGNVTDSDILALERRLLQTMDMIVSKKKRIAMTRRQMYQRGEDQSKQTGFWGMIKSATINIVFDRVGKTDPVTRGIEITVNYLGIQFDDPIDTPADCTSAGNQSKQTGFWDVIKSVHPSGKNSHCDSIAALERDMAIVQRELATQKARNEDLEAWSRRCNLRITGIKERREDGKRQTEFISQCLKETLGLDKLPLLDRAHRTLRARPGDSDPPRAFVIKCHYLQEKEAMLRKAGEIRQLTTGDGDQIRVQPDYTQAVAKQRAEFNEVRGLLRTCEGIRYGLWYPAELRITTSNGERTSFKDPKRAKDFIMNTLKRKE
ncbi:hypothetical protein CRUP_018563 [Coryphaenoides rupestris]|nr:hypothetical protein CRUP_018563 [Coryphaenoides rupestris]